LRSLAIALTLCSSLDRTVTAPAGGTLRVVADEYSFDPSTIVLKGAGTLTVRLENKGSLAHNLKVLRGDEQIGGTPAMPGGRTASARLDLGHGTYRIICSVGDHEELGMHGTLRVR
jgi:plastocyanin